MTPIEFAARLAGASCDEDEHNARLLATAARTIRDLHDLVEAQEKVLWDAENNRPRDMKLVYRVMELKRMLGMK